MYYKVSTITDETLDLFANLNPRASPRVILRAVLLFGTALRVARPKKDYFANATRRRPMKHLKPISRRPLQAQGQTTFAETLILMVLGVVFQSWDNFSAVSQNLQKYFSKTP